MILMRANPLQGPVEGVGPENRDNLEINSDMEVHKIRLRYIKEGN
jgi:hypothetical protein